MSKKVVDVDAVLSALRNLGAECGVTFKGSSSYPFIELAGDWEIWAMIPDPDYETSPDVYNVIIPGEGKLSEEGFLSVFGLVIGGNYTTWRDQGPTLEVGKELTYEEYVYEYGAFAGDREPQVVLFSYHRFSGGYSGNGIVVANDREQAVQLVAEFAKKIK